MKLEISTIEEQFWNYMFYMYLLEFGIYSNIMMQQIGGI